MRLIISQMLKHDAPAMPDVLHNEFEVDDLVGMQIVSDPGYELAAVYVVR